MMRARARSNHGGLRDSARTEINPRSEESLRRAGLFVSNCKLPS